VPKSETPSLSDALRETPQTYNLGKVAELLERNGISVEEVGRVQRISLYQTITKDSEGVAEVHDLQAIQLSPSWETGPEWELVRPGPAVKMPPVKAKPRPVRDHKVAVIVPDMQIGYFRNAAGVLEETHDEAAMSVMLAITAKIDPDLVVLVGDNLDFPAFGKYRLSPAFAQTTQASIDRATTLCAQLRHAAPNAVIKWIAGNHEERLTNFIIDNASAAFGLRVGNSPDSWPILSVPFLCDMDTYGIDYIPGYPAGVTWINENLKVIHGTKHKSNGSTAHAYLATEKVSVLYGHIHRREWAERTRDDWDGPKTTMAASPGCLARIDGAVPSTKGSIDLDGRPMSVVEDWQQGIAVVTYDDTDNHHFWYEQVPIHDGRAMYRGHLYGNEE
jgi:hypothetical protein